MAKIDDLLSQVVHDKLRGELAEAVANLRRGKKFGLVYEEHIPETTLLPAAGIREGSVVVLRHKPEIKTRYIVERLDSDGVTITDGDIRQTLPLADLLVVKPFGEPVYPLLKPIGTLTRNADKPYHAVINGENFHALQLLLFTYKNKADCIYLDPPYNTGARDWKYNNDYVDKDDSWRHSKWLSFMEKRLRLAKQLLKPDGVLFVTIDENEVHHLGVLLDQLYPEYDRTMLTTVINPKGTIRGNFGKVEEYVFVCIPRVGRSLIAPRLLAVATAEAVNDDEDEDEDEDGEVSLWDTIDDGRKESSTSEAVAVDAERDEVESVEQTVDYEFQLFRRRGSASLREDRWRRFFPIYIREDTREIMDVGEPLELGVPPSFDLKDGLRPIWPIDSDGNDRIWRWQASRVREILKGPDAEGRYLVLGRHNMETDTWTINLAVPKRAYVKQKTVWWEKKHDSGTHGTTLLQKFLGGSRKFPYPKSLYVVRDTLDLVVRNRSDALILDFFAGSGTTLHATCLLNAEDGGHRRCILVTNNEVSEDTAKELYRQGLAPGDDAYEIRGICRSVTIPRVQAALTGIRADGKPVQGKYIGGRRFSEGFRENAAYFDLVYEDPDKVEIGERFDDIIPTLWLAAGAMGEPDLIKQEPSWLLPEHSPLAVLLDEDRLRPFLARLHRRPDVTHVWLVTDSEAAFARMRERIPGERSVGMLYRDYLRSFAVNVEVAR